MAGTSNLPDTEVTSQQAGPSTATFPQLGQQRKQTSSQKATSVQKRRTKRKRKNISSSKKTIRPTKNKPSHFEQKSKETALAQTKLTLVKRGQQQNNQRQQSLVHMDLITFHNSKTIKIINIASGSSAASPARIVTSSSRKGFMNKSPRSKKHIDNLINKIKATNKAREEQTPEANDPHSDTDYANIITIKKLDPQQTKPQDNNSTQQNPIFLQPQHSSTPIHQDDSQQQQTVEHDSTSDIENEPQLEINSATKHNEQPQRNIHTNTNTTTKTSEQSPISALNTEDMEELDKLIFD